MRAIIFAIDVKAMSWFCICGYREVNADIPATLILVLPIPHAIAYEYGCNGIIFASIGTSMLSISAPSTVAIMYTIMNPFVSDELKPYLSIMTAICGSLQMELVIPIASRLNPNIIARGSPIIIAPRSPNCSSIIRGPTSISMLMFCPLIIDSFAISGPMMINIIMLAVFDCLMFIHVIFDDLYSMTDIISA